MGVNVERIPAKNDDGKLREDTARASQARAVLENPLVREAFEHIDSTLIERWKSCSDPDTAEEIRQQYKSLLAFKRLFEVLVSKGTQAASELDRKPVKASRFNTP